jgi:hypothetical protein
LERLVLALEEQRDYSRAIPYAQRLVHHDPLHEAAYRYLMRLHLALGNRAEARHLYHACAAMLQQEFGLAPSRATRRMVERLLTVEDEALVAAAGNPVATRPPAPPLVGRTAEWSRLIAAWRAAVQGSAQMVVVTGEPGIGKTRLAEELCTWVSHQAVTTATASCYPTGSALAYGAVAPCSINGQGATHG